MESTVFHYSDRSLGFVNYTHYMKWGLCGIYSLCINGISAWRESIFGKNNLSLETFGLGDAAVSKHFSAHACSPISLHFLCLLILTCLFLFLKICSVIVTFLLHLCEVTATNMFYYFQNAFMRIYIMLND